MIWRRDVLPMGSYNYQLKHKSNAAAALVSQALLLFSEPIRLQLDISGGVGNRL